MFLQATIALALLLPGANPADSSNAKIVAADSSSAKMIAADFHPDRPDQFPTWQAQSEQRLLELTNAERRRNGLAPLQMDATLTTAARTHAAAMASRRELSHQLAGEAALGQRIASSALHLTTAGENVALDVDIDQAHDGLMHSPPHRENILKADYNVVGFGVARVGDRIYVTEDFGRKLATVPVNQAEDQVAASISSAHRHGSGRALKRLELASLRKAACEMAGRDRVDPKSVIGLGPMRYVLTYTDMQPGELPSSATAAVQDGNLRSFAVGACYAQTPSYPNGAYWVTVALY
jgi:uncharacterized protein YkwD